MASEPVLRAGPVIADDVIIEVTAIALHLRGVMRQQELLSARRHDHGVAVGIADADPGIDAMPFDQFGRAPPLGVGHDQGVLVVADEVTLRVKTHAHGDDVVDEIPDSLGLEDVADDFDEAVRVDRDADRDVVTRRFQPGQELRQPRPQVLGVVAKDRADVIEMQARLNERMRAQVEPNPLIIAVHGSRRLTRQEVAAVEFGGGLCLWRQNLFVQPPPGRVPGMWQSDDGAVEVEHHQQVSMGHTAPPHLVLSYSLSLENSAILRYSQRLMSTSAPKTYHVFTLGCQQNKSDSERVASVFSSMGYEPVEREEAASVIVVNACAIRQTAMDRVYGKLRHWTPRQKKGNLRTILTGCVLEYDRQKLSEVFDHVIKIEDIGTIPHLLGEGEALNLADYFSVAPKHNSEFKAFVPIMTGCDKFCTYCAVPYTRGREISRPVNDILDEVKHLIARGYKEVTLLGQNVNSYAGVHDKPMEKRGLSVLNRKRAAANQDEVESVNFPRLLELVAQIPGDFWVRYITSHPYDMSDELIETMAKHDKLVNYINLPVQSGDNDILKKMNRHYTVDHYLGRVKKIRETLNPVSITTDIIIGFCGETEEQFQNTAQIMREVGYDMAYLNKYSPRPGTVSARKFPDDISWDEKVRREQVLNDILKTSGLKRNTKFIGQTVRVLVDEVEPGENGLLINTGKTALFKNTRFSAARSYLGQFVNVRINDVQPFGMAGELV